MLWKKALPFGGQSQQFVLFLVQKLAINDCKRRTFSCEETSIYGKQALADGEYYEWRAAPWHKLTKVPPTEANNNFSLLLTSKAEAAGKMGIFMKGANAY